MAILKWFASLVVVTLGLVACGGTSAVDTQPTALAKVPHVIAPDSRLLDTSDVGAMPNVGEAAPDFEYTMSDGATHRLSELRGKRVLLNFWATWCEPCRAEMPDLQRVADTYGDAVVILGVNKLEPIAVIPPFADELQVRFPLVVNTKGDIANRYWAKNIPTSFFINSDGTVGFRQIGVMNYDFVKLHLDQLK
jgi:thiol-disulfide isomerase/thioredoxin